MCGGLEQRMCPSDFSSLQTSDTRCFQFFDFVKESFFYYLRGCLDWCQYLPSQFIGLDQMHGSCLVWSQIIGTPELAAPSSSLSREYLHQRLARRGRTKPSPIFWHAHALAGQGWARTKQALNIRQCSHQYFQILLNPKNT